MNRKLISDAFSDMDDVFIEETMFHSTEDLGHPPERTANMENKRINSRRIIGLVLAACLVFTLAVTAYAADIGGIRSIIMLWLQGEETTVLLDVQEGHYTVTAEDGSPIISGGGVVMEADGSKRPVTEEEVLALLDQPDVYHKEDGTIWVYYREQKIEITDMFDDSGFCYLELQDGDGVLYVLVDKQGGLSTSQTGYPTPWPSDNNT